MASTQLQQNILSETEIPDNTLEDLITATKPAAKRARANTNSTGSTSESQRKKSRKDVVPAETPDPDPIGSKAVKGKKRAKKIVEPREPLPERVKRVQTPGAPDQKTGRRTSAKLAADIQKHTELEKKIEILEAQKRTMLAQMEIDQEREQAEEDEASVNHITDMYDPEDDDEEFFNLDTEDASDNGAEKRKTARQKKATRGETRAAVESLKIKLKGMDVGSKGGVEHCHTVIQPRPRHLSGLVAGWSPPSQVKPGTEDRPKTHTLGGFTDDDVITDQPTETHSWSNQTVHIVSSSSESDESHHVTNSANTTRTPVPVNLELKVPQKMASRTLAKATPSPIKREESSSSTASSDALLTAALKIPQFIEEKWVTSFLPTLYHCILSNDDPFGNFLGGNALPTIRLVFKTVFPDSNYEVIFRGRVYEKAYERGMDLRARIARSAITVVTKHFAQDEFKDNPAAITKYVKWAVRDDGPMLFRVPAAQFPVAGTPSKAVDLFQSSFIVEVVKPVLKGLRGSKGYKLFSEPKAAFALAAAAVERAFLCFRSGKFKKPSKPFGNEAVGNSVQEYMENFKDFSQRRWTQLLDACKPDDDLDDEVIEVSAPVPIPTMSTLDGKRRKLYVASSPAPEIIDN
ncbi:hypothetical protein H0H81_009334 [Sphagnurus paluster]|uniref:Uncharacterized protein n=1 Tax=Sphagnurus paluster TaxID=117069 RepID=A0A9P7FS53_9AGAR|nr:hypothetical protein H0H81_009334 [Sphagnurus paluster]